MRLELISLCSSASFKIKSPSNILSQVAHWEVATMGGWFFQLTPCHNSFSQLKSAFKITKNHLKQLVFSHTRKSAHNIAYIGVIILDKCQEHYLIKKLPFHSHKSYNLLLKTNKTRLICWFCTKPCSPLSPKVLHNSYCTFSLIGPQVSSL